jgi:hypothetical protein
VPLRATPESEEDLVARSTTRLYIGKASNLRMRVRQGLVKGKVRHPGGARVRAEQDLERLLVRWSLTDRPGAAEEELHRAYVRKFGRLPEHVRSTWPRGSLRMISLSLARRAC